MSFDEKRLHRCCFTGHRPQKLGISEFEVKKRLKLAITDAVERGFTTFISGMAMGVDVWAAQIVLALRRTDERIKLICTLPFDGFENNRTPKHKAEYRKILNSADLVKTVCPYRCNNGFRLRNMYMVDNSSLVIAFYNGSPGGTQNTIVYAKSQNVEVRNICDI